MSLLGQVRQVTIYGTSSPHRFNKNAMAPLGHVELTKMQNLLKSKNNQNVKNKMKTKPKIRLYFHFRFCCHFGFRFCFFYFRFSFCFYFRFCFCFIFLYILSLNFTMARQGHYRYLCQKCLSSHS